MTLPLSLNRGATRINETKNIARNSNSIHSVKTLCLLSLPLLLLPSAVALAQDDTKIKPVISGLIRSNDTTGLGAFERTNLIAGDTGTTDATRTLHGILQFDLSAIDTTNLQLVGVSLNFTVNALNASESANPVDFQLWSLNRKVTNQATWSQTNNDPLDPNHFWQTPGATGANDRRALVSTLTLATASYTAGSQITFTGGSPFLAEVQQALEGDGILGLWLGLAPGEAGSERHTLNLASPLHATASYHPQLVLQWQAVPEPSGWAMIGTGGLLLLSFARKARTHRAALKN